MEKYEECNESKDSAEWEAKKELSTFSVKINLIILFPSFPDKYRRRFLYFSDKWAKRRTALVIKHYISQRSLDIFAVRKMVIITSLLIIVLPLGCFKGTMLFLSTFAPGFPQKYRMAACGSKKLIDRRISCKLKFALDSSCGFVGDKNCSLCIRLVGVCNRKRLRGYPQK